MHITTGISQICIYLTGRATSRPLVQTSRGGFVRGRHRSSTWPSKYDACCLALRKQREATSFLIRPATLCFVQPSDRPDEPGPFSPGSALLMGPTGAGKSRLAKAHLRAEAFAPSGGRGFVEVSCATIAGGRYRRSSGALEAASQVLARGLPPAIAACCSSTRSGARLKWAGHAAALGERVFLLSAATAR